MAAEDLAILKEFVNPVYLEDDATLKVLFFLCKCEKKSRRSRMCSSFPLFFFHPFVSLALFSLFRSTGACKVRGGVACAAL
jgi:hypothetical protein